MLKAFFRVLWLAAIFIGGFTTQHSLAQIYVPQNKQERSTKPKPGFFLFDWVKKKPKATQTTSKSQLRNARGTDAPAVIAGEGFQFPTPAPSEYDDIPQWIQEASAPDQPNNAAQPCTAQERQTLKSVRSFHKLNEDNLNAGPHGKTAKSTNTQSYKQIQRFLQNPNARKYMVALEARCGQENTGTRR